MSPAPSSVPRLSIVMPVLDEAAVLPAVLARLQALRARGVELIVADGGSSDGSAALAAPLCDAVVHAPRGRARQMNAGAARARGSLLLFLHADTTLPDGADRAVIAALRHQGWGRFDVRIDGRPALLRVVAALMNLRSRLSGIATGDQAMFMRRTLFDVLGGFPDQPLMEDIELSARLKHHAGYPACLRGPLLTSGRRWERDGLWRTIVLMWRLRLAYWLGTPAERLARAYR